MSYVDGFLIAVPIEAKEAYRAAAAASWAVFAENGALQTMECWGDDLPDGKVTDFKRAVAAEAHETVVFSWIVWPSREVRDAAQPKIMADPRLQVEMPFDGKRMVFGGFEPIFAVS